MIRVWDMLEIPPGSDRDTIRRAYAKKLRLTHPEDDPEGFKRLREAYEAALHQHDWAARWADFEDEDADDADADTEEGGEGEREENGADAPAMAGASSTGDWRVERPVDPPAGPDQEAPPELRAMLAARESELDQLHADMAEFENGLRGPWRPGDAALEQGLEAILASPAMAEIGVRTDVEAWLANLLAATIPHSDVVLLRSIQTFGWAGNQYRHQGGPAIGALLGRLDEWRIIEGLNHHSHAYHAAWRSLTRPPGAYWFWRLDALRPGLIGGVETLLGLRGEVAAGLHHSFHPESVARWRDFLARPRLTPGILALAPITFLALLWLGYILAGPAIGAPGPIAGAALVAALVPPVMVFAVGPWRQRWRIRTDLSRRMAEGWIAAHMLLAFTAMLPPPPFWPLLIVVPAIAIAAWAHIVTPPGEPGAWRIKAGAASCLAAGVFSLAPLGRAAPAEAFALATMASLLLYLRIACWPAVGAALERWLPRHREGLILGGVLAGLGATFGLYELRALFQPVLPLYLFGLAAVALLPLVGAPAPGLGGPPRWIARAALAIAFFLAYGASVPPSDTNAAPSSDVPVVETTTMDSADAGGIDARMAALEQNQPGFGQVREGNPPVYAAIRDVMVRFDNGSITRDEANAEIGALVYDAYRRRAPDADSGLLVEGLRIRLDRQRALRDTAPADCASTEGGIDESALPEALRKRQTAQIYNVISNPPASPQEIAAGHVIDPAVLTARIATMLDTDVKTLVERGKGLKGPEAACAVRIAYTQALLDNRRDDIAATLRRALRRERDAPPPAGKADGG